MKTRRSLVSNVFCIFAFLSLLTACGQSSQPEQTESEPAASEPVAEQTQPEQTEPEQTEPEQPSAEQPAGSAESGAPTQTFEEANAYLQESASKARADMQTMSFEEFQASVYKEPFEGGKYIVNGDTPVLNEKHLREFFQQSRVKDEESLSGLELIVHRVGGMDAIWNNANKLNLSYCVSTTFGGRHAAMVAKMAAATGAWEAVANVRFIYNKDEDARCTAFNQNVMFDVRPINAGGRYLARAFFPNESRFNRNVLVDGSSFQLDPRRNLQLAGILRHELGHTLGFRHEHTRAESGACFEDRDWRPLTDYDPFSVMHYPQCNGLGDWTLSLTKIDSNGAACIYGPAQGFVLDSSICPNPVSGGALPTPSTPKTESFTDQTVARLQEITYGPFQVSPGTVFDAVMTGAGEQPGDPDLYARFGQEPEAFGFDCRPYTTGAEERCELDVPDDARLAFVKVRGFLPGTFSLTVTHTPTN